MRILLTCSAALVLTMAGCSAPASQGTTDQSLSEPDMEAIRSVLATLDAAYTNRDVAGVRGHFTADVAHLPPGEPAVVGIAAVMARDSTFLADFVGELRSVVDEIGGAGDYGYARYSYTESWTPRAGGETTAVAGKGVALFERGSDGSWRLTHFVWNHDGDM